MWLASSNHKCNVVCGYKPRRPIDRINGAGERIHKVNNETLFQSDLIALIASSCPEDKRKFNHEIEYCIIQDAREVLEELPEMGCDKISLMLNNKNQTAIHLAFYKKAHNILNHSNGSVLFSRFKDHLNYVDRYGLAHLHVACVTADIDVVREFLDQGEDVNARYHSDPEKSRTDFTPLHFAVTNECRDVVELLLQRGADVNAADWMGRTALHLACGLTDNYDRWLRGTGQLKNIESTLNLEIIELLLKYGCDLNAKDKQGNTPLVYCFQKFDAVSSVRDERMMYYKSRQLKKVELLLKHGADVKVVNNNGNILHWIVKDLQCFRFPVSYSNISFSDSLHAKCIEKVLVANQELDVDAKNSVGETPLQLAISLMSVEVVKILLQYNADFSSLKFNGKEQIQFMYPNVLPNLAAIRKVLDIIDLLSDKEYILTLEDHLSTLKFMMNNCGNYESTDIYDKTNMEYVMWNAVYYGSPVKVDCLSQKLKDALRMSSKRLHSYHLDKTFELQEKVSYYTDCQEKLGIFKMLGSFKRPTYFRYRNREIQELTKNLNKEVASMKTTYLSSGISLYNVTTADYFKIYRHVKDNKIDQLSMNFPSYVKLIQSHVAKSLIKGYIEKTAYQYLKLPELSSLPDLCWKNVVSYLSNEDVLNLSAVILDSDLL